MKRLAVIGIVGAAFFGPISSATAQDSLPEINNYTVVPKQIAGQTCLENQDNKEIKCADLTTAFAPVASLSFHAIGSRDVLVQYCAKVEDTDFQELECRAMVDGKTAAPGTQKPIEQATDMESVTIYVFCMSWFGETAGGGRGVSTVDIECERKNNDPNTMVRIDSSTTSVFFQ